MTASTSTKTVGINLLWLVPGTVGGSEESTIRSLLAVAQSLHGRVRLRCYVRPDLIDAHPALVDRLELVVVPAALGNKAARIAVENTWLSVVSRADDLIHHAGGAVTLFGRGPRVTTIHDLQPLDLPGNFSTIKRTWLRMLLPLTVKRSSKLIVPSQFTAGRCRDLLGATDDQLVVLPHPFEAEVAGAVPDAVAGRTFLLSPGIAYPHKRHADAIRAFAAVREHHPDLVLVFTGRPGSETAALHQQVAAAGLVNDVLFLGRIPAAELAALYQAASVLLFPSEYEGFGYPLLEAMANGCPVVTAAGGAAAEVVGDAGIVVPVGAPEQLASAVRSVLDDPSYAARLVAAGYRRAADFTYEANGVGLAGVYCDALGIPHVA